MADIATQYPTSPTYNVENFETITPAITSDTNTGRIRRAAFGHSYYQFEVNYPTLTYSEAQSVRGYVAQLAGQLSSFEIVLPRLSQSRANNASVTITVSANANAGARTCTITGAGNTVNVLKAGDYFRFSNHTKVYQCVSDVTSNSGGAANINFGGGLVTSVTTDATVIRSNVAFTVILNEDISTVSFGAGGLAELAFKMRETW